MSRLRFDEDELDNNESDAFIRSKFAALVSSPAEEPVEIDGKKRIKDAITNLTKKIESSSVGKTSGGNSKENMSVSEKTKFAVERGIKNFELKNDSDYKEVTKQRALEYYFLCGEMLNYLASTGDKKAIELLELCKASGIIEDRVYRFK